MNILLAAAVILVFCAPGYPGGAGDAKPYLDQFANAAARSAGWPEGSLQAVYDPTQEGGLAKLAAADAALAFVPYPFFVQYASQLHLRPIAQADITNTGTHERWTLVAKAGHPTAASSLAGSTILSVAGYAPEFVRHAALGAWGLPADVKIQFTGQILSALRKVATDGQTAALLDQQQAASLATLPFAGQIATLTQSAPLPAALVAIVDSRLPEARVRSFQAGLLKLGHAAAGAQSLSALQLQGFVMPQLPAGATRP